MLGRDNNSMFGTPLNILRACSLALLFLILVTLISCYPNFAAIFMILVGIAFLAFLGFGLAYVIGEHFGWWEYMW